MHTHTRATRSTAKGLTAEDDALELVEVVGLERLGADNDLVHGDTERPNVGLGQGGMSSGRWGVSSGRWGARAGLR